MARNVSSPCSMSLCICRMCFSRSISAVSSVALALAEKYVNTVTMVAISRSKRIIIQILRPCWRSSPTTVISTSNSKKNQNSCSVYCHNGTLTFRCFMMLPHHARCGLHSNPIQIGTQQLSYVLRLFVGGIVPGLGHNFQAGVGDVLLHQLCFRQWSRRIFFPADNQH